MSSAGKVYLSVEIPLSGDGFPNPAELKARNQITDALDKQRIGVFVGAGGGMGAMDFSYVVEDEQLARDRISAAIKKRLPDARFTIEAGSADDIDLEDLDDDDEGGEINWPRLTGCLVLLAAIIGGLIWIIKALF
jgi:hypothetical protein